MHQAGSARAAADAAGTVRVALHGAAATDNAEFDLHLDGGTNASPAGVELHLVGTSVLRNGTTALDKDGVRVDERGDGGIRAAITGSHLGGNGAEGVELDEGGGGGVDLLVTHSTFNDNGFFSEEDAEDGIDVDEADAGDVRVVILGAQVNGNFDEGVDLNEGDDGSLFLSARASSHQA